MKHTLKPLPYPLDALNPHISKQTMEYHYGKHHLGYVNTLNNLIAGTKFEDASLETIVAEADGPLYNNAAQIWDKRCMPCNHLRWPNVSVHTFRALHTYMCTAQLFCLVFSQEFNIMSAHFLHQA